MIEIKNFSFHRLSAQAPLARTEDSATCRALLVNIITEEFSESRPVSVL